MNRLSVALLVLAIVLPAATAFGGTQYLSDFSVIDFENRAVPYKLIGTPNDYDREVTGAQVTTTVQRGQVKIGSAALKFEYTKADPLSPALLDTAHLLRDFISLSFWIKSKEDATWVVYLLDLDDAGFIHITDLPAGEWVHISLTPEDFESDPNSDNPKPAVDVTRLDVGMVMLDGANKYETGENTVYIDNFLIARPPFVLHEGDFIVDMEDVEISEATYVRGDLIVKNGGLLDITAGRFEVEGNVIVENREVVPPTQRSRLNFIGGAWGFHGDYPKQYSFLVQDGSELTFTSGTMRLLQHLEGEILLGAKVVFDNTRNATRPTTWEFSRGATLELINGDFIGEFLLGETTHATAIDSELIVFWLQCVDTLGSPIILPDGKAIDSFVSPPEWKWGLDIQNSSDVFWTLNALPNCNAEIQDTELLAIGMTYWEMEPANASVSGLQPNLTYEDFLIETTNSSVRLVNSSVDTWNVYTSGEMSLAIDDSLIGEVISFSNTTIDITNSSIDGSGGHLGSQDNSLLRCFNGDIRADIRSYGSSRMEITDSLIAGSIYAADSAEVVLDNTEHLGRVFQFDDASVTVIEAGP